VDIVEEQEIDLIISAVELGEESANDFLDLLYETDTPDIPVILVTGADSAALREHYFRRGILDYLLKKEISYDMFQKYLDSLYFNQDLGRKLKHLNIAVLDDSQTSLNIIKKLFDLNGVFNVDYFKTPKKFIESRKKYQLVLVDIILPGISGEELILQYRRRSSQCVIIAVSSIDNIKTVSNILSAGANDYLIKPFDSNLFMARIKANIRTYLLMEELEEKRRSLERMAVTDGLTELYNHKHVHRLLEEQVARVQEYHSPLSVAMLDLDFFKKINDDYGHQSGDEVLRDTAIIMKQELRDDDVIGRYGGEEFLIIFSRTTSRRAKNIVERIRQKVDAHGFGTEELRITLSAGVSSLREDESSIELVNRADELLYRAKEEGRNRVLAE